MKLKCLLGKHRLSLGFGTTKWRPVIYYNIYCRYCGKIMEMAYMLEQTHPDLRRLQLQFSLSKYLGGDQKKAGDILRNYELKENFVPLGDYKKGVINIIKPKN